MFGVERVKVVSATVIDHVRFFYVVAVGEGAHVCVGLHDFADKNCVVACCEFVFHLAFDAGEAFKDGGCFNGFSRHGG